ncbi:TPA: ash family protein [Salmonella enterica]|nr:ash family protein [Salmonella enterica]
MYRYVAPAKSGVGIGLLKKSYRRHMTRQRLFLCCTHGCTSMVGRTVASKDAPVSDKAGKTNSARFHHP